MVTNTLILVESPAKCKKIESYLGPGYKCLATFGHLRELTSLDNIDFDNDFSVKYSSISARKSNIADLKRAIKTASEVILATDDDREGEAIAWHVCDLFGLNVSKTKRIVFHEITEPAVLHAVQNPSRINMNIVNAQKTRQILDLLVGFKISPMLWKYISKNQEKALSAGRCQTPALKLVYDNYIHNSELKQGVVYNTVGFFTNKAIEFALSRQFDSANASTDFLDASSRFEHRITVTKPKQVIKSPPDPFTTSRLQQTASNLFRFSPKETMKICQTLYEEGYITYMRTDSKTYSNVFIDQAGKYIGKLYGEPFITPFHFENAHSGAFSSAKSNGSMRNFNAQRCNTASAQSMTTSAHEAIRPTDISLVDPEGIGSKEQKMYTLIRENTLESCMSPATYWSITASIKGFDNTLFTTTREQRDCMGWTIVKQPKQEDSPEYNYLLHTALNSVVKYTKLFAKATFTNTKSHYTEARLVQLLEEKGIGRPSTFASLVDKIQERGYVVKQDIKGTVINCSDYELSDDGDIYEIESTREVGSEKGKLVIQNLGIVVIEFLTKNFTDLFDYDYTRGFEDELDKISAGTREGPLVCKAYNDQVDVLTSNLRNNAINANNVVNSEKNEYIKVGQYDGHDVILKNGKFGLYASWGKNSKSLSKLGNRPIENIRFEEIEPYLKEGSTTVREVSPAITIRKGPKGDYIFYKMAKMTKPIFYKLDGFDGDYKSCDIDELKSWIKETYKIY